jgi:hypothetical protein
MGRRPARLLRIVTVALLGWAIVSELRKPKPDRAWHGTIARVLPYDLRPPTLARVRERWWNPDDDRVFTPHVFGVGWSINLSRLLGRRRR